MKTTIEVKDRREGELIRTALADEQTRAFVIIMGALLPLDKTAQTRIMRYVEDFYFPKGGVEDQ